MVLTWCGRCRRQPRDAVDEELNAAVILIGVLSGLICFCICEKRPVPEYPNELGEVVLSIQLGGKWWGLRSSLPGLIPFAFVCKREKQHWLIWSTNLPMCKVHKMRQHYTIRIDSLFFGYFWSIYQCRSCWIIPISQRFPEWLIGTWLADSSDGMKSVHLESPGVAIWCFWNQSIWGRGWVIFK